MTQAAPKAITSTMRKGRYVSRNTHTVTSER
jgi:hypothetical protein